MTRGQVQVTYSAPALFLSSDNWLQIYKELAAQFPLRDLLWKSPLRPSPRNIPILQAEFISLDDVKDSVPALKRNLLEQPLLNIYVVTCEDNDAYRTSVRKQIRDWHSMITQRRNQEWLILLVVRTDTRVAGGGFLKMKGSVLDKIKSDFNSDKRDRCIQVLWSPGQANDTTWNNVKAAIGDLLLSAFDASVAQREEEVKRSESQRQMPGWNFCSFFLFKESLADSFDGMGLLDDSSLQYDELEASFFQALKEKNMSWFGKLIAPDHFDDSLPILSLSRKPYQDLIRSNTISIFDFRIYLLARQCDILARQNKVVGAARKVQTFIGTFCVTLHEAEQKLPRFFVQSWAYASTLSAINQCDYWHQESNEGNAADSAFDSVKGELLDLAVHELTRVGLNLGYLPEDVPFFSALDGNVERNGHEAPGFEANASENALSNQDFIDALTNPDGFYDLYGSMIRRAIDMYAKAGRRKFAIKLFGKLAALDRVRGRIEDSRKSFRSLPGHYGPSKWATMETYMHTQHLSLFDNLNTLRDSEWLQSALSIMKYFASHGSMDVALFATSAQLSERLSNLMADICSTCKELDEKITLQDALLLVAPLASSIRLANTYDGTYLDIMIHNLLPISLHFDSLTSILRDPNEEEFIYSISSKAVLNPGKSTVTVFCPTPSSGLHIYVSSRLTMGNIVFDYSRLSTVDPPSAEDAILSTPVFVHVPKDYHAACVDVRLPPKVRFGAPGVLLFAFNTGRNDITKSIIQLGGSSEVIFHHNKATSHETSEGNTNITCTSAQVQFESISENTTVMFYVPYSNNSATYFNVAVAMEYYTTDSPSISRIARFNKLVDVGLPVSVNVEDIFRNNCLFSVFSIHSKSDLNIRIREANLFSEDPDSDLEISSNQGRKAIPYTASCNLPVNFIFKIRPARTHPVDLSPLIFRVKFRTVKDEILDQIEQQVKSELSSNANDCSVQEIIDIIANTLFCDGSAINEYLVTGVLQMPKLPSGNSSKVALVSRVIKNLSTSDNCSDETWRTIDLPVELPVVNVVSAARIDLSPSGPTQNSGGDEAAILSGKPVNAELIISTSFQWGPMKEKPHEIRMMFEIQEIRGDWLVSGRKRGEFIAQDASSITVPLTLVPLRHGEIALPAIHVAPASAVDRPSSDCSQQQGAIRITVLPHSGRSTFVVEMGGR